MQKTLLWISIICQAVIILPWPFPELYTLFPYRFGATPLAFVLGGLAATANLITATRYRHKQKDISFSGSFSIFVVYLIELIAMGWLLVHMGREMADF